MKLDCILTVINENLLYLNFIFLFVKTWKKLYPNVDVIHLNVNFNNFVHHHVHHHNKNIYHQHIHY